MAAHNRHGPTNPSLDACKRELLSFPASGHDDQVDAFSQLLTWAEHQQCSPAKKLQRQAVNDVIATDVF
jgi:hypothetical protein